MELHTHLLQSIKEPSPPGASLYLKRWVQDPLVIYWVVTQEAEATRLTAQGQDREEQSERLGQLRRTQAAFGRWEELVLL